MSTPSAEFGNRPLDQWKVTELKDELRRRKITTKGVKEDLVRRLEEAFRNDEENVNPGTGQAVDSYGYDNKDGDHVQNYYPGQIPNPDYRDESVANQNPNDKDEDEYVTGERSHNLNSKDIDGGTGNAEVKENDLIQDNKVAQEIGSSCKFSESNAASSQGVLLESDVDGEEPKSEVQTVGDALDSRSKDAKPEESDSLNQVSEKVSPVVGFQLKCESVSTDSVSIIEENELKDSLNADNVNLESKFVKTRMMQESSGHVSHQGDDSYSAEQHVQVGAYQNTVEERGNDDDDQAMDVDSSLKDDRIEQQECRPTHKDNVVGNDGLVHKHISGADEMERKSFEDETRRVNLPREGDSSDPVAMGFSQDRKEKEAEDSVNDVGTSEKRKKEDSEVGLHEPAKRQRRWNSGNNLSGDATKVSPTDRELPAHTSAGSGTLSSSTMPVRDRPSVVKPVLPRSDSMNNGDAPKERVVLPSQRPPTTSLRIDRFLRPFTLKAVQELLAKTGTVSNFWMDHIKTHCFVTYSSTEEAVNTRNALYNLQWPPNGGRQLIAEFVDPEEVKLKIDGLPPQSPAPGPVNAAPLSSSAPYNHMPFKTSSQGTVGPPQHALPPPPPLPLPPPPPLPPASRERQSLPPKKVEAPVLTLDDLFKKTRANPRIYYLPLSEEEVAAKLAAKGRNRVS